jgi:uncharacterized membrane protein YbhN (UPF0104 family)
VLLLAAALVGTWLLGQGSAPPSAFERALIDLAASVPAFLDVVWRVGAGALVVWAVLLIGAALVRLRLDIFRDLVLAAAGAAAAASTLSDRIGTDHLGTIVEPVSFRLAVVTAATVAASPHIARPFRTTSRWVVTGGGLALVVLAATTPSGAVLGLLCGTAAAAIVHLVFGSSGGRPPLRDVAAALGALGVDASELTEARRQVAGVFLVDTTDEEGRPLQVKVYGRDAWDSQLLAKAWRSLWYRDANAITLTRLQQAEHEAFVTLLADRHGVPVDEVVTAGRSATNDALLVLRPVGVALPAAGDPAARDRIIAGMWDTVLALRAAGIAHGDLGPHRFTLRGDDVVVTGLEAATVSPTGDQQRTDLAQVLVTTALWVGTERAVRVASDHLGTDALTEVLPYLQPAALGRNLRVEVDAADLEIDELRAAAARAVDTDPPALTNLRRVSPGTLARAALLSAAAYLLITSLSGVDLEEVADSLRGASWSLLAAALVVGQTPRLSQAIATRGACPRPLAYGPVALLQYAISFVNLVVPSTAARVAVNIRFFQRQGIPPASAVSIGVIDSLGGFAIQVLILISALTFGSRELDLGLDRVAGQGGDVVRIVVLVGLGMALLGLLSLAVPAIRHRLLDRVRPWLHEVGETVGNLRSPTKLAQVLGGNLGSELLFATTLGLVLAAVGTSLPLGTILVINVLVSLFAGLMPVPGGIGVSEGALVFGLTAAGVDDATAFAAAIAYRMVTFYLPPLWGALAFRHLEREGML